MTTASQIPPARAVFTDGNGVPISGGFVNTYVAGTTTPKTTWQDVLETIPNANPVLLDGSGSCLLFGTGTYSLAVTDSLGNAVPGFSGFSQAPGFISDAMLPVVGALTLPTAMTAFGITPAMQPFVGSATLLAAAATLPELPPFTGSVQRLITAKLAESVSVLDFGAVGDGVTDDTAAFSAALNSRGSAVSVKGGVVTVPAGYSFKISSISIPSGVTLQGPYVAGMGAPGLSNFSPPYNTLSWLRLTAGNTIVVSGGAAISGCIIAPSGMTFQQTNSAAFAGTAITANGDDVVVEKCLIMGFNVGFTSTGFQRVRVRDCNMDNINCVSITGSQDTCHITGVHCWPFATISQAGTDTLRRAGFAFNIVNGTDDTRLTDCFAYGYLVAFNISNSGGVAMTACASDSTGVGIGTGFAIIQGSVLCTMTACLASGQDNGFYITDTIVNTGNIMVGCMAFGNANSGVLVDAAANGDVTITGGWMRDMPTGIAVSTSVSRVDIDGVHFENIGTPAQNVFCTVSTANVRVMPSCNFGSLAAGFAVASANLATPAIASAAAAVIPPTGDLFGVSGTTNISTLAAGWSGRRVTLVFAGILAVVHGTGSTSSIRLSGAANFTTANGSTLTLVHNGVQWFEAGRCA